MASNEDVFNRVGKPCLEKAFKGMNSAVFAYGQTASGKSYTMGLGDASKTDPGLIPRIVSSLFDAIRDGTIPGLDTDESGVTREFKVRCSFFEVFNDADKGGKVKDLNPYPPFTPAIITAIRAHTEKLFASQAAKESVVTAEELAAVLRRKDVFPLATDDEVEAKVKLLLDYRDRVSVDAPTLAINLRKIADREPAVLANNKDDLAQVRDKNVWVPKGLAERPVTSLDEVMTLIEAGTGNRRVGKTDFNEHSSRSHAIVQLRVIVSYVSGAEGTPDREVSEYSRATISLVDLAGSERLSKAGSERVGETKSINLSLMYLGQVIDEMSKQGRSSSALIKMRMMSLTRLLASSFGGDAETWMLACVNPSSTEYAETLRTLDYAGAAREIVNTVEVNQSSSALNAKVEMLRRLMKERQGGAEADELQRKLAGLESLQRTIGDQLEADRSAVAKEAAAAADAERLRQEEAQKFKEELSELELRAGAKADELRAANERLDEAAEEITRLQKVAAAKEEEFQARKAQEDARLAEELAKVEADVSTAEERAAAAARAREQHQSSLSQLEGQLKDAQGTLMEATTRQSELATQKARLSAEMEQRKLELATKQGSLKSLETVAKDLQRKTTDKDRELAVIEEEVEVLLKEVEEADARLERQKDEAATRMADLKSRDEALRAEEQKMVELDAEIARFEEQANVVEKQLETTRLQSQELQNNIEEIQRNLQAKKTQMELLNQQIDDLISVMKK